MDAEPDSPACSIELSDDTPEMRGSDDFALRTSTIARRLQHSRYSRSEPNSRQVKPGMKESYASMSFILPLSF